MISMEKKCLNILRKRIAKLSTTNQREFRIKTIINRKIYKPYVKRKGNCSFNSWIDKKDIV